MNRLTARVILFLFLLFILPSGCRKEDVSPAIARHEKAYPDIRKKYVYQSLIRLANINRDPEFEKLIRDVRKVIIYLPPKEDSTYHIKDLRTGMRGDGYEELLDIRTSTAERISLWSKESEAGSHFMALVDSKEEDVILEIDGHLHVEYLSSIMKADQGSLRDLIKGGF